MPEVARGEAGKRFERAGVKKIEKNILQLEKNLYLCSPKNRVLSIEGLK
jgi:hypothetical protein